MQLQTWFLPSVQLWSGRNLCFSPAPPQHCSHWRPHVNKRIEQQMVGAAVSEVTIMLCYIVLIILFYLFGKQVVNE